MNLSRLLCSLLRNDRRLSEINARGLWHAIHFNLRSVSFMTRDNDDVLVPLVDLLLLVAAGVRTRLAAALHTRSPADRLPPDLRALLAMHISRLCARPTRTTCSVIAQ